tara:strand:+ start:73 stop:363 length:291 start_codon:yes stop_codon:yes gene_type:complete
MLHGKETTLTIKSVKPCEIVGESGRKDKGHEIWFEKATKPHQFSCQTTRRSLTRIFGTDDYREWEGKKVTLYPEPVKCKGQTVIAIRYKAAKGGAE